MALATATDALDVQRWTKQQLSDYVGGLSAPSKMPCHGYSLPAKECRTGSKLRAVQGSTCSGCYALKGRYKFPKVQDALYRRLQSIDEPLWVDCMAELITRLDEGFFRWHDSGDLQSIEHLTRIVAVCELTPHVSHWLPTREYRIVTDFVNEGGIIPDNLSVRMSAHMIGGATPTFPRLAGMVTLSTVSRGATDYPNAHHCPAPSQGNSCGDCRACWSRDVSHVDYHVH